jgi:hypothetical protein
MPKRTTITLILFLAATVSADPALADDKPDRAAPGVGASWTIELDITDTRAGAKDERFVVALPLVEGSCSEATAFLGTVSYSVRVCDAARGGAAPVVSFDVERVERSKQGADHQRFKGAVRLAAHKRAVVGKLAHADGEVTLVGLQLGPG